MSGRTRASVQPSVGCIINGCGSPALHSFILPAVHPGAVNVMLSCWQHGALYLSVVFVRGRACDSATIGSCTIGHLPRPGQAGLTVRRPGGIRSCVTCHPCASSCTQHLVGGRMGACVCVRLRLGCIHTYSMYIPGASLVQRLPDPVGYIRPIDPIAPTFSWNGD